MRNDSLLQELLAAETEDAVVAVLHKHKLLVASERWKHVGNIRNNSAPIFTQQSSAPAALVEKNTNAIDALLLAYCKALGIDPRGKQAREELPTMADAVEKFFPNLASKDLRKFAAENLVLYATGSRDRPSLALYDSGEGQFASAFPNTFCSLIHADASGSYKGAIPFVQGRFNMGGTGVLPYCGERYMLQLIVSRVPSNVAKRDDHEWACTLFCYFPSEQDPAWKYLVGPDGEILTAGAAPLALVPDTRVTKDYECLQPRERKVSSGTLIKMYDYKVPKGNICGDLYRKLQEFLLQPALPLRIVECRPERKAKVMSVTMWDALAKWRDRGLLEEDFEDGASIAVHLDSGHTIPAEIRVFKLRKTPDSEELDVPLTGVRALINGQSHAHRTDAFFKTKAIDKEHVADSMLVTLD